MVTLVKILSQKFAFRVGQVEYFEEEWLMSDGSIIKKLVAALGELTMEMGLGLYLLYTYKPDLFHSLVSMITG